MALLLALIVLVSLGGAVLLGRRLMHHKADRHRANARQQRQRMRVLHWEFLNNLFGRSPKRLTYKPPADRDDA